MPLLYGLTRELADNVLGLMQAYDFNEFILEQPDAIFRCLTFKASSKNDHVVFHSDSIYN